MARNEITDYSPVASENTDIGGVGLSDNDSGGNLRDAEQEMAAALARVNSGDAPLDDTFKIRNAANDTKEVRFDVSNVDPGTTLELDVQEVFENLTPLDSTFIVKNAADATKKSRFTNTHIPTATTRILDAEALNRNGAFIQTKYTTGGTHTFATSSRYFQIVATGAGGGGGGVQGSGAGTRGAASGGSSGFFGITDVIAIGAVTSGTVSIGSGGAGGSFGANDGSNGGNTTWNDGTNSFAFGGGKGGKAVTADGNTHAIANPPNPANSSGSGTIYGTSDFNTRGHIAGASTTNPSNLATATGGVGGGTDFGVGGAPGQATTGGDATGYGAGGGGAAVAESVSAMAGGGGAPGILFVREW